MSKSLLEKEFLSEWKRIGGQSLIQEFKFHPERKWRFDFVHEASKTAIEIDGGSIGLFRKNKKGLESRSV